MAVGMPAVADRSVSPARGAFAWRVVVLLLALAVVGAASGDALARTPGAKDQFKRIAAAWSGRDAATIVAFVPPKGSLSIQLTTPRVAGTFKAPQATKTLQKYFQGVTDVSLKDVTEKNRRSPRNWLSRSYEYTYRPRGHDEVKTLLTVTMKGDGRGAWWLNSIAERPLPRRR